MTSISSQTWSMTIAKRDLIDAIGTARARPTLRRIGGAPGGVEPLVIFSSCDGGLSVRSSYSAMDIPADGEWASPIAANGAALRRLAPKLTGTSVEITYADGQLALNQTRVPAREI